MKGKPMNKIATWLAAGVIVATAVAGCSVTVNDGDGGTGAGATGGTGGTGATGGSGGTTGGTAGTTGGSSGSGGTAGSGGSTADAGSDAPTVTCTGNPNARCSYCGFMKCQMEHCACNAVTTCKTAMDAFYTCAQAPNANFDDCAATFVVNANPDGSTGGLANELATCMDTSCVDTCAGREAGTSNRDLTQSWKLRVQGAQH
jgi:hypothetical protein